MVVKFVCVSVLSSIASAISINRFRPRFNTFIAMDQLQLTNQTDFIESSFDDLFAYSKVAGKDKPIGQQAK